MRIICLIFLIPFLQACPLNESLENCEKVMVCEDDKEMLCEQLDSGCGEVCSYYVYEHCYQQCKEKTYDSINK